MKMSAKLISDYYDIAIIPPEPLFSEAIRLSKEIGQCTETEFVLGQESFVPHISLYHVAILPERFSEAKVCLQEIMDISKLGELRVSHISTTPKWAELMVRKEPWLQKFHENILYAIAPLRNKEFNGVREEYINSSTRPNVETYGSPWVGEHFTPHITLTVFKNKQNNLNMPSFSPQNFKVTTISIYIQGPFHSCQKKVFDISP